MGENRGGRGMKADVDDLLAAALNSEYLAVRFYKDAAGRAKTRTGRKFFKKLKAYEEFHFNSVKKIIESRIMGNEIKIELLEEKGDVPALEAEIEGEFEPGNDEILNMITMAIQAEEDAQQRYKKISEMIADPEGKRIFCGFVQDEKMHQRILEDLFYQMINK